MSSNIYVQWLSGRKRQLYKVANPSSHLSVVGKFLWTVSLARYLFIFVTLYQHLPTNEALPKELHPVYSMLIATPSVASIVWAALGLSLGIDTH